MSECKLFFLCCVLSALISFDIILLIIIYSILDKFNSQKLKFSFFCSNHVSLLQVLALNHHLAEAYHTGERVVPLGGGGGSGGGGGAGSVKME